MSQPKIELNTGHQNFWAVAILLFCIFGGCSPSSPSHFEQWLHAAYGYKIDSRTYNASKE